MADLVRPAGTEQLRRHNTSLVLRALRRSGAATRTELSRATGLAKATVGVIVGALEAGGAVAEGDTRPGARGRPGRPVTLRGDRHLGLGLELNVDYVSAVVVDLAGGVRHSETRPVAPGLEQDTLLALAREVRDRLAPDQVLVGATVAVPGLVRGDDRTVAWTPNLGVEGTGVADRVEEALGGCRVRVSNDANCAAYAEAHRGAAVGASTALYLTGTVGIGAGIVDGGELVRGAAGFAGEVGHLPVGSSSALCGCGRRGCWEAAVGLHAMLAAVGMSEVGTPLRTAQAVAERAATDDGVRRALAHVGSDVGLGLAILAGVLDPAVVVLGGYFVPLGDLVLGPARATLDARLPAAQHRPELRLSTLGILAAATGAAEQSFADVLSGTAGLVPVG